MKGKVYQFVLIILSFIIGFYTIKTEGNFIGAWIFSSIVSLLISGFSELVASKLIILEKFKWYTPAASVLSAIAGCIIGIL